MNLNMASKDLNVVNSSIMSSTQKRVIKAQQGISSLGLLCLLLLFGAGVTLGLKIVPLYMDNRAIDQAFISASSSNFNDMTRAEIRERIGKSFQINGIKVQTKDIEIVQKDSVTTLRYVHEERANLFSNVDIAIRFENYFSTADE